MYQEFRWSFGGVMGSIHIVVVISHEDDGLGYQISNYLEFHRDGRIQQYWIPLDICTESDGVQLDSPEVLKKVCELPRYDPYVLEWEEKVCRSIPTLRKFNALGYFYQFLGTTLSQLMSSQDAFAPYWEKYAQQVYRLDVGMQRIEEAVRKELGA